MSVSSHLSPDPERRLWIIHESLREEADAAELKIAALAAVCGIEAALAHGTARAGLAAVVAVAALSLQPGGRKPARVPLLDPEPEKPSVDDSLIAHRDIVKYAYGELVLKLDRYLGGGITNTRYYEDVVAEVARQARRAARKRRLLVLCAALAALAQLILAARALG